MLTFNDNHEYIQSLRDSGLGAADFQVAKAPVEFRIPTFAYDGSMIMDTIEYPSKEVYYRTDTNEPIAVHGLRYNPVQYSEMINKTRDMLERSDLNCEDIEENIQVSPNGGMCLVDYTLPATNYETPDGDRGSVKVLALSSFNGVWSFILSLGFQQWACLNHQIMINNPASIYKCRHTNKLNVDKGVNLLGQTANLIENEIELWNEWANTYTSITETAKTFASVSNYTGDIVELKDEIYKYGRPVNVKNKTLTYLYDVYNNTYKKTMGETQWAVYNAVTDWSTHAPSSAKNVIALKQRRIEQATTAIQEWLKVA